MFKLGIVGHQRAINIVVRVIRQHFQAIETTEILMETTEVAPVLAYIKANEHLLDALIFTGKTPYDLINTAIFSQKPWVFIRRDSSQLLSVLLEASLVHNYDIRNVSIDSCSEEDVYRIYDGLKIPRADLNIQVSHNQIFPESFLTDLKTFHRNSYMNGKVSFCVTGISNVYEYLLQQQIPCFIFEPTIDSVKETLKYLDLKMQSRIHEKSQIVVLAIERDLPNEHALIKENEYQLLLESMKISEEIYLFAQRIQAAVVEKEIGRFLLFTTKNLFEIETDHLRKINLLTTQTMLRFGTLSIGIGYGETARESKYNAHLGLIKAKKCGGNHAYKVENNQFLGPILLDSSSKKSPGYQIDGHFQEIAAKSGISINSIIKLQTLMDQEKINSFTPLELARLYGVSLRSMNRLLGKLIDSGYAQIIGCNMRTSAGRPSRIIQFDFVPD